MADLNGKVVLVTGAASGIGRAVAVHMARHGAQTMLADRDLAGVEATRAEIASAGGVVAVTPVEMADSASVDAMVDATVAQFGALDVLVHCAAILRVAPLLEMTDAQWREVIAINLDGTFYASRSAARQMVKQKSGKIILMTSDRGLYGHPTRSSYATSKGGIIAFLKSIARELGPHGITVNGLNPGQTDTPMMRSSTPPERVEARAKSDPLGRISTPEDAAEMVLFMATNGGEIMTGQVLAVRMVGG
jgi:NAD(P)-dependent dehydrogenase (short-subunit alcohol dehydrogenase family)